jgi:hypothetical protein
MTLAKILITILFVSFVLMCAVVLIFLLVNHPKFNKAKHVNAQLSDEFFIQDGQVVYVLGGNFFNVGARVLEGADSASFELIDRNYGRDHTAVFFHDKKLPGADPNSARVVTYNSAEGSASYLVTDQHVYWLATLISDANASKFTPLWGDYSRDDRTIFYTWDKQHPITGDIHPIEGHSDYLLMGDQVLRRGELLNASAKSFRVLNKERYQSDDQHVFYDGEILSGIDPESFTVLSGLYTKDDKRVFYRNKTIAGANPSKFSALSGSFGKDDLFVYHETRRLMDADVNQWNVATALEYGNSSRWVPLVIDAYSTRLVKHSEVESPAIGWQVFAGQLYSREGLVTGVSPHELNAFDQVGHKEFFGVSGQVFYVGHRMAGAQENSFQVLGSGFSRDKNQLFYQEHLVAGIDPETFDLRPGMWAKADDNGIYRLVGPED